MSGVTRRSIVAGMAVSAAGLSAPATAQQPPPSRPPAAQPQPGQQQTFGFEDVVKRAREVASAPHDAGVPALPEQLAKLNFDAWRDIRFRADRALLGGSGSRFRLQLFHVGHLFQRPVTINTVRDGVATPIPYSASLFDYGRAKFDKPLPVNLGFAGFRIHFPLNDPRISDELLSFVGASYFRWLGRDQKYGLSARGLAIDTGLLDNNEEFPFFREFWIDTPDANADRLTIYALLDGPSVAGAYRFVFRPGPETPVDIEATLFPRKPISRLGMAPLTSMFFIGENDRHLNDRNKYDEYRPELHDSDGLLIQTEKDDWIWRPIHNPVVQEVHNFPMANVKGFGLIQRDRKFANYQDIELNYELRPSYWIEPSGNWGEGRIELVELATRDETADNIIVAYIPNAALEPGRPFTFSYRMRALHDGSNLNDLGRTLNTFNAPAHALGSAEAVGRNTRRFLIDFVGGDLAYHLALPSAVEIVASATNGKILRKFLTPNPAIKGFRAMLDVEVSENDMTMMTCFLQAGHRRLTETWNYTWKISNL